MEDVSFGVPHEMQPRPGDSPAAPQTASPSSRPTLGPGYDFLLEFMRQIGRPAAFMVCLCACMFQIYAPPALRMDGVTFGLFVTLLMGLCGLRSFDLRAERAAGA